eukprot:jgi/Hompol1/5169/HPOL_004197-RA
MICGSYMIGIDIAFWVVAILIPFAAGIGCSSYLANSYFTEHSDLISSIIIFFQTLVGVGIRYYVVESANSLIQPTLIMNLTILLSMYYMRVRFIYSALTTLAVVAIWIIINIPPLFTQPDTLQGTGRTYAISFIVQIVTGCVVSFISYEIEYFHRMQFLMSKEMKKNNAKLTNQLKVLAKSYNKKAGSLDSPLERSVMVIRSVMADPVLSSQHLMALGQVHALLSSSNLLTPDLEGVVGDSLDNEQEAWLFSEVAARRQRGRASKPGGRRRMSMTQEVANKIEPTIAEGIIRDEEERTERIPSQVSALLKSSKESFKPIVAEDPGSAYPPVLEAVVPLLSSSIDYNWNLFEFATATQNNTLMVLSSHLFASANLFDFYSIPIDKFRNFVRKIASGYHADLPYHNAVHATDVLHCMSFLANNEKIKQVHNEVELFSMYIAAMIHDHDHPGFTNNFMVNTYDPKAMLYNDKSVLENHHLASSFSVLNQAENNFLSHLSRSDFKAIREIVIDLVLATDLTQHFTLLSMFKAKVASSETFDPDVREDRMLLYKIMIKCSDVSNPSKEMSLYEPWCRLISSEFYRQGDMEKKLGLPVSPYMDRDNVNVPSSQIGFIDYVVMPLFEALDKYQPIPSILSRLQRNREHWAQLKAQGVTQLPPIGSTTAGNTQPRLSLLRPSQSQTIAGKHNTSQRALANSPAASHGSVIADATAGTENEAATKNDKSTEGH